MKSFFEWYESAERTRPWLILGKGPSFNERNRFDLSTFDTIGLNHVCREQPVTVAHFIDLDVIDALADVIETNTSVVVMPWFPHTKNNPFLPFLPHREIKLNEQNLEEVAQSHPVLRKLDEQGRLLWYNLSSARGNYRPGSPVVPVRFFSVEAALSLLVEAGARTIRSIGIDGGVTYSSEFTDLKDKTLLANGRSSFDRQFEEIARVVFTSKIDFAPLTVQNPIRVFVATMEDQMLAVKVLEFSIRKHASMNVEVVPMHRAGIEIPKPADTKNLPRTPFSFQRFLIPELCGYSGRAIYLDSDMQVFSDIRQLWTMPFHGAPLLSALAPEDTGRKPQFSVMLLDCAQLQWNIRDMISALDRGVLSYEDLMYRMSVAPGFRADIDPEWNSLERYVQGQTALVHYTDMTTQPWVSLVNPLGYLWMRDLFEALDTGFITRAEVERHVEQSFVRPSLLYQIDHRIEDSLLLPARARALDAEFRPPYLSLPRVSVSAFQNPGRRIRAAIRHYYQRSGIYRLQRRIQERFSI